MIDLILDRECHNGRRPERLSSAHWRFEARGDNGHYCYYFHATVTATEPVDAVLDIAPDGDLLPDSAASFRRHRPEHVWLSRGRRWERHPIAADPPADCVRVRVHLDAGESVSISRMHPYPYSAAVARVGELAACPAARAISLGRSVEDRDIVALQIGTGAEQILALAGQHPAEFGGTEAVFGIADWLLSRHPDAVAVRERYTVTLVPVLNPDGNVAGRCGHNAAGGDLYRTFAGAATGTTPEPPEAACLWRWITAHRPALTLNFHTYTQPSPAGSFPWEGLYTAPDAAFPDDACRDCQRRLDDLLAWDTDGLSQSGAFAHHVPGALEYQLAALGVPTVFYEVQDAVGPQRHRRTGVQVLRAALRGLG